MEKEKGNHALRAAKEIWEYVRELTYNFIEEIPDEKLSQKLPRPALDQIGKHFLEMGDVTFAYAEGLKKGSISFEKVRWEFPSNEVKSKSALKDHLKKSDKALEQSLREVAKHIERTYELDEESLSLYEVLIWLALHEILHHGQLVAYGYFLKTGFPISWIEQWALPDEE